jgi:adenylosuccinate lyase
VLRNLGMAYGYSLLAYQRIVRGLDRVAVNADALLAALQAHPEVLAEAIQTILRRVGYTEPYEALKQITRGRALTMSDLHSFIESLPVDEEVKVELRALTPDAYLGLAAKLARLREG